MTIGPGLAMLLFGSALFIAALSRDSKPEPNVNSLEQQRSYQIIYIKEHEVTCFKFDNGVACIPDYQLNTRKKYEG